VFQKVGTWNSDAEESPKRKNTTVISLNSISIYLCNETQCVLSDEEMELCFKEVSLVAKLQSSWNVVLYRVTSFSFCHSDTHLFPLWSSWAAFGLWEYQVFIFLAFNFLHPQTPPPFLNHWVLYDLWHRIHWKLVGWIEIPFFWGKARISNLWLDIVLKKLRTERVDRVEMHATSVWKALGSDPGRETVTGCYYTGVLISP
jgi:hypothetical protein